MATEITTASLVIKAMKQAERTKSWTARKADMPLTTFNRKLRGEAEFSIGEVARIAVVLSKHPADLLPPEFEVIGGRRSA